MGDKTDKSKFIPIFESKDYEFYWSPVTKRYYKKTKMEYRNKTERIKTIEFLDYLKFHLNNQKVYK